MAHGFLTLLTLLASSAFVIFFKKARGLPAVCCLCLCCCCPWPARAGCLDPWLLSVTWEEPSGPSGPSRNYGEERTLLSCCCQRQRERLDNAGLPKPKPTTLALALAARHSLGADAGWSAGRPALQAPRQSCATSVIIIIIINRRSGVTSHTSHGLVALGCITL